jgi:hypothetical protein
MLGAFRCLSAPWRIHVEDPPTGGLMRLLETPFLFDIRL